MESLGVEVDSYDGCNFNINRDFLLNGDWMQPFHHLIPSILEKMPVLIYAVSTAAPDSQQEHVFADFSPG